jgi:hypothetical protein
MEMAIARLERRVRLIRRFVYVNWVSNCSSMLLPAIVATMRVLYSTFLTLYDFCMLLHALLSYCALILYLFIRAKTKLSG